MNLFSDITLKISGKLIIAGLFVLTALQAVAQNNTSSPYSMYGIGDLANRTSGRYRGIGSTTAALRNDNQINLLNPASYTAIDSLSFLFEFGIQNKFVSFETENSKHRANDMNIHYFSMAFPVTKWGAASIGVVPFSNIGYNINLTDSVSLGETTTSNYYGKGGINQFYIGGSVKLFGRLSIGANASYLYGDLVKTNTFLFPEDHDKYALQKQTNTTVGDFHFTYGIQYAERISETKKICLGIAYENKSAISVTNKDYIATTYWKNTDVQSIFNSRIVDTILYSTDSENAVELPSMISIGVAYQQKDRLTLAADFTQQNWKDTKFLGKTDSLANSMRISAGMEYVPDISSISKYLKRTHYRLGGHFTKTRYMFYGTQLLDYGMSFGLGLPLKLRSSYNTVTTKSALNVSFDLGRRGSIANNLVQENYFIVTLNVTLYDRWFVKPKFD